MKIFLFCLIFFFFFALDKKWRDLNTNGPINDGCWSDVIERSVNIRPGYNDVGTVCKAVSRSI